MVKLQCRSVSVNCALLFYRISLSRHLVGWSSARLLVRRPFPFGSINCAFYLRKRLIRARAGKSYQRPSASLPCQHLPPRFIRKKTKRKILLSAQHLPVSTRRSRKSIRTVTHLHLRSIRQNYRQVTAEKRCFKAVSGVTKGAESKREASTHLRKMMDLSRRMVIQKRSAFSWRSSAPWVSLSSMTIALIPSAPSPNCRPVVRKP